MTQALATLQPEWEEHCSKLEDLINKQILKEWKPGHYAFFHPPKWTDGYLVEEMQRRFTDWSLVYWQHDGKHFLRIEARRS